MAADPNLTAQPADLPAPSLRVRLLWWFGIYLAAQLPLLPYAPHLRALWIYPIGLLVALASVFPTLNDIPGQYVWLLLLLTYGIYLAHLSASLRVHGRKAFWFLMIGLLVLGALDTVGVFQIISPSGI